MSLNASDAASVTSASFQQVIASLQAAGGLQTLSATNPYSAGLIDRKHSYTIQEIAAGKEVLSVSGPNHCIDGWSFLSRALSSVLAGDLHSARHFAYYAELRATLSLLSAGGVGIFDHNHFVISATGSLNRLQSTAGTHSVAWDALETWSTSSGAAHLFANAMPAGRHTVGDILQKLFPSAAGPRLVAGEMLTDWGIDIRVTNADRVSRNSSSYRPQIFTPLNNAAADNVVFIHSFWRAFEPYATNRFDLLDRHIVRLAIQKQMSVLGIVLLEEHVYDRLDEVDKAWISLAFINRQNTPDDHPLLQLARQTTTPTSPFSMISRAALLLRVATAITRYNLDQAGKLTVTSTEDWLTDFCLSRALVEAIPSPLEATELWYDVEAALDRLDAIVSDRAGAGQNVHSWHISNDHSPALPRASEAERVAIWGLAAQ